MSYAWEDDLLMFCTHCGQELYPSEYVLCSRCDELETWEDGQFHGMPVEGPPEGLDWAQRTSEDLDPSGVPLMASTGRRRPSEGS